MPAEATRRPGVEMLKMDSAKTSIDHVAKKVTRLQVEINRLKTKNRKTTPNLAEYVKE